MGGGGRPPQRYGRSAAGSTSISNQEAFERYVMKVKSNVEAARRFMNDEGIVDKPGLDRWLS